MDLKVGEVITTPSIFVSTTHTIVRNNLTLVLCDIDPEGFTIDTAKIEGFRRDSRPVCIYELLIKNIWLIFQDNGKRH